MDSLSAAQILAAVRQETAVVREVTRVFGSYAIGPGWTGATRREAEVAVARTIETLHTALHSLGHAEQIAQQAWLDSLHYGLGPG